MNEYILELAALLLALFCYIYSLGLRRDLYESREKGLSALLKDQHAVYLAVLVTVMLAALASLAGALAGLLRADTELLFATRTLYELFHALLFPAIGLYVLDLSGPVRKQSGRFFLLYFCPSWRCFC